ncbi:hypothetical protein EW146_g3842 [Bondarzewia mesenterica]|uniref:Type 1 phosphatases regulator n=1 Tax=Bondarzewia mesenterica TaxID=1095465 RepID=A0A4V3XFC1_9AGAM|nr:hypothetical protein EW146_g3842 [Bondarzewia mesenterica]
MTYINSQSGPSTSAPADGSRTITIQDAQPRPDIQDDRGEAAVVGALRLRGITRHRQTVSWVEDVVDNEGMGRKKTKICCIYHKPKRFDESSSEESSGSDSDSDSSSAHHRVHRHHRPRQLPDSSSHENGSSSSNSEGGGVVHELQEDAHNERNAYETMPPNKGKGKCVQL